jgi:hypothetical protein
VTYDQPVGLARELVHHGQELERPAVLGDVEGEVQRPHVVSLRGPPADAPVLRGAQPSALVLAEGHLPVHRNEVFVVRIAPH